MPTDNVLDDRLTIENLAARVVGLERLVADSAQHDSWRCAYYPECHCGLDEATDQLGLPRVPRPPKS